MAELATMADLEDALGRTLTSVEASKAAASLRYASSLVRALAPWVDSLSSVPPVVADVVAAMAARRMSARLDGVTQEAVGQVSRTYRSDPTSAFTVDERLLLNTALGTTGNASVSLVSPAPFV